MSVHLPRALAELWPLLDTPGMQAMAGGTDLLVQRRNKPAHHDICCLERLTELRGIQNADGIMRIGAATTLTELLEHEETASRLGVLHQALRGLGSPLIRNQATLGGNICTASPAGDTLPALHVLEAELELQSQHESRILPLSDFITGPGKTVLGPGEILVAVRVPLPRASIVQHFEKVGKRRALAIAVVGMAALLRLENDVIREIRMAFGSVGPTVIRCPEAEAALTGQRLERDALSRAAGLVRKSVRPISDVRATADYRRQVAGNLVLRLERYCPTR